MHEPITDFSADCDDGDVCTGDEYCGAGTCLGSPVDCNDGLNCTKDGCLKDKGCTHTPNPLECNDGDPCTKDGCDLAEGCTVVAYNDGATCDDLNACTEKDVCGSDGTCVGDSFCSCSGAKKCDSKNLCIPLVCEEGLCEVDEGKSVACDASNDTECAKESCDPNKGQCVAQPVAEGLTCDDGNPCTTTSKCKAGQCLGSGALDCNDNNICTKDACSPIDGCQHVLSPGPCKSNDKCATENQCEAAGCVGKPVLCDDAVNCTLDSCDPATGKCTHNNQDNLCDDDNPCTTDTCQDNKGCAHPATADAKCDDGDACTKDACDKGKCVVAEYLCDCKKAADCDDKNPCTTDTCNKGSCSSTSVKDGAGCDTANKCHVAGSGVCKAGSCDGGKDLDCSAGVGSCAAGVCDPSTGKCQIVNKPDDTSCDADGNGCTAGDACQLGKCVAGAQVDCSAVAVTCKKGVCKSDGPAKHSCVATNLPKDTACDDGNFCTVVNVCDAQGKCSKGSLRTCAEAGDACNKGFCNEDDDECGTSPLSISVECNDGEWCTLEDHCNGKGVCIGGQQTTCAGGNCAGRPMRRGQRQMHQGVRDQGRAVQ